MRVSPLVLDEPGPGVMAGLDMGPALNSMAANAKLVNGPALGGFAPPPGFVGCVGPEKLSNLGELANDSTFKNPPPLIRQKAQFGGGL